MSGRVVTTSSPLMTQIRAVLDFHCSRTGPMTSMDVAALLKVRESMTYKYMRQLEQEGSIHVAAWRLEDSLSRFQDVPEFLPGKGPGYRAPKSCRSRRDTEKRKTVVITSSVDEYPPHVPMCSISRAILGLTIAS